MEQENREEAGAAQTEPAAGQPQPTPSENPAGTMQPDAVMVFLSYFGIFALIPLLTVKDNDYVRWHAKQGLTFMVAAIAASIALSIVAAIIGFVPVIGGIFAALLGLVIFALFIGCFVLWIMALVKAFGGERWKIPLVGDLSERW